MSGEVRDNEAARMRFCADKGRHVTRRLVDRFQHLEHQAGYRAEEIDMIKKAPRGDEYLVVVRWMELDEKTWAPVSWEMEEAPVMLERERNKGRCGYRRGTVPHIRPHGSYVNVLGLTCNGSSFE